MKKQEITINATLTRNRLVFKSAEGVYYKEYKRESLLDNSTFDDSVFLDAECEHERKQIEALYPGITVTFLKISAI